MSLQDIFYLMAIIFMTLLTVFVIVMIILLFFIKNKIGELSDNVNAQITKVGRITSSAEEVADSVSAVASGALRKVSSFVGGGSKKSK